LKREAAVMLCYIREPITPPLIMVANKKMAPETSPKRAKDLLRFKNNSSNQLPSQIYRIEIIYYRNGHKYVVRLKWGEKIAH
jgi:hypothetical protein